MRQSLRLLDKFANYLFCVSIGIGVVQVGLVLVMITVGVFVRWFGGTMAFVEEYVGYSLVYTTYMALAYAVKTGDHTKIDIVFNRLSKKTQRIVEKIGLFLTLATTAMLLKYGWHLWMKTIEVNWKSITRYPTPLWIPQTFMVVGLAILCIALLVALVHRFVDSEEGL